MSNDLEQTFLKAHMNSDNFKQIVDMLFNHTNYFADWIEAVSFAKVTFGELGMSCVQDDSSSLTLVLCATSSRRKKPAVLTVGLDTVNVVNRDAVVVRAGKGLVQLIPKGVYNVNLERTSAFTPVRREAES